jgi:hypothetical protein
MWFSLPVHIIAIIFKFWFDFIFIFLVDRVRLEFSFVTKEVMLITVATRPLRHWDHGFESHLRHGYLCTFILCAGSGLTTG